MKTLILVALVCVSLPAFGQIVADPNDRLYEDLEMWMDRGLTDTLPPLRPYPVQLVVKVLAEVAARGDETDQKAAAWYLSRIEGGSNLHGIASSLVRSDAVNGYLQAGLELSLQGSLYPWITYSAKIGGAVLSAASNALLPEYQRSGLDYINDSGTKPIGGVTPRMTMIGSGTIGTDAIYVQAGAIRGSYGPFWGDNAVLSPSSPQSGQFSFVIHDNAMSFTMLFMDISATDQYGNLLPDKFLSVGGLELYPLDWLTVGVFDAVVWGKRFEPLYLLPVVSYYTQGMAGFPDNSFIGVSGEVKLPGAVKADFILYVDDAYLYDLIRLNFNTKLLAAFQVGVSWTPNLPFLTRLRVTNLLITPYTYSHDVYSGDTVNYLNYTNNGQNIGPSIQPNSDRIEVEALMRPIRWLDVDLFSRFIIHGNASAGIPGLSPGDGSINDSGTTSTGQTFNPPYPLPPGYGYLRFLTQAVLEKTFQAGFDTTAYLDTPIGQVQVSLSYTFEYVLDGSVPGVGPVDGNNAVNNYVGVGVTFTY